MLMRKCAEGEGHSEPGLISGRVPAGETACDGRASNLSALADFETRFMRRPPDDTKRLYRGVRLNEVLDRR